MPNRYLHIVENLFCYPFSCLVLEIILPGALQQIFHHVVSRVSDSAYITASFNAENLAIKHLLTVIGEAYKISGRYFRNIKAVIRSINQVK